MCASSHTCSKAVLAVPSAAIASHQQRRGLSTSADRAQRQWQCRARRVDAPQEEEDVVADAWSEEVWLLLPT